MADPVVSSQSKAHHYRELALWTNDERTQHILLEMARELELETVDDAAPSGAEPPPIPRPLS